jgi:hypothetical protein
MHHQQKKQEDNMTNDNAEVERALEALSEKAPEAAPLEILSWREAPAGVAGGTLKGYVKLRLPSGESLDCALNVLSGERWLEIPLNRERLPDGSSKWTPRLAFASETEAKAFQLAALARFDQFLATPKPAGPVLHTLSGKGSLLEMRSEAAGGQIFLAADEADVEVLAGARGIPRGLVWTPEERALIQSVPEGPQRTSAMRFKRSLSVELTRDRLDAWKEWQSKQEVSLKVSE